MFWEVSRRCAKSALFRKNALLLQGAIPRPLAEIIYKPQRIVVTPQHFSAKVRIYMKRRALGGKGSLIPKKCNFIRK